MLAQGNWEKGLVKPKTAETFRKLDMMSTTPRKTSKKEKNGILIGGGSDDRVQERMDKQNWGRSRVEKRRKKTSSEKQNLWKKRSYFVRGGWFARINHFCTDGIGRGPGPSI